MSDSSPRLNLPYIAAAQAQKHVTVNQGLGLLDALVQCAAESRTVTTEPQAQDGQLWILPPGKTGPSWGAMPDHALAHLADGAWQAIRPGEGWTAFVKDEGESVLFSGGAWSPLAADRVSRSGDAMTGALSTPRLELNRPGAGGGALSVTDAGGVALAASAEPRLVVGGPSAGALFLDDGPFGRVDSRPLRDGRGNRPEVHAPEQFRRRLLGGRADRRLRRPRHPDAGPTRGGRQLGAAEGERSALGAARRLSHARRRRRGHAGADDRPRPHLSG